MTFAVAFTRPDGTVVSVEGFYDGGSAWKARAYCDMIGSWTFTTSCAQMPSLHGESVHTAPYLCALASQSAVHMQNALLVREDSQ